MSFLYPRTCRIYRPDAPADPTIGAGPYNVALKNTAEQTLIWPLSGPDIPCNIQLDRQGQRNVVELPSDARYQAIWRVFIPLSAVPKDTVKSADVVLVTDATPNEYFQVFAPYWNSLGFQLRVIRLEA